MVIQHTILKDPLEDQDLPERSAERLQIGRSPEPVPSIGPLYNLLKPIDSNNLRFNENILATTTGTNDTRNTGLPNQNQHSGRPPFDVHLENFEYVSSKYSLDEICACLELRSFFKLIIL